MYKNLLNIKNFLLYNPLKYLEDNAKLNEIFYDLSIAYKLTFIKI